MSTYAFATSPFSGLSLVGLGFEVPPGDPGALDAAAAQAQAAAARLESNARTVRAAVGAASADWTGVAHSAFHAHAAHLVLVYAANAGVLARAGKVLSGLARELESAQRQTRQAQDQCSHYHALAQTQTQTQQQHAENANQLHLHASLAAHPHIHAQLKLQAQAEQQLADQAAAAASQAKGELATWTKHGRDAYTAYQQHAHTATSTLSGLKAELRHPPQLHGGQLVQQIAPIPLAVRQIVAQSFRPGKARFTAYPSQVLPLTKAEIEHAKRLAAYQQAHGTEPLLPILGLTRWELAHPAKTQALLRRWRSYNQAQTAEYDAMLNPLSHQNLAMEGGLIKAMFTPASAEDIAHGHFPSGKHLAGDAVFFWPWGRLAKAGDVLKAAEAADESMTVAKTAETSGRAARAADRGTTAAKEADAFHYTRSEFTSLIDAEGLRPGTYLTKDGKLSPLQAQIDLALPPNRGLPDALIRVDLAGLRKAGYDIGEFTRVGRKYNMPGGGTELRFERAIPARFVKVVRR